MSESPFLSAALAYAAKGWHVFPCVPKGKPPLGELAPHGWKSATTDPDTIKAWWGKRPDANIGIALRPSGLCVVDLDPRNGADVTVVAQLREVARVTTVEALSGGGGAHWYFWRPRWLERGLKAANGIDLIVDGYVVAPPSVHPSGGTYTWEVSAHPDDVDPVELPRGLFELVKRWAGDGHSPTVDIGEGGERPIPEGRRNTTLTSYAGYMRAVGMDQEAIEATLQDINRRRCMPPLPPEDVAKIAQSVARYEPKDHPLTDAGNAEAFADYYATMLRYHHRRGVWYVWEPPIWREDTTGQVVMMALELLRIRQQHAAAKQADKETRAFLLKCEDRGRLRAMLDLAKSMAPLATDGSEFDQQKDLLAVKNGVLDLRTGELREGRPEDYLTHQTTCAYIPEARAERWERFIGEVFAGNVDLVAFIQRALGYSLTGHTKEQTFFYLYGVTGSNGKSTLLDTMRFLLGSYAADVPFSIFLEAHKEGDAPQPALMGLAGRRLVTATEKSKEATFDSDILKLVTGEDVITGRGLFESTWSYKPEFKLWLATNRLLKVADITPAFWRRPTLVPFSVCFEGREEKDLRDKLFAEAEGILCWLVEGAFFWYQHGLNPPQACKEAVADWRRDNDPLAAWLEARCELGNGHSEPFGKLFESYKAFFEATGARRPPIRSERSFAHALEAHRLTRTRTKTGSLVHGIRLKA